jgi:hypothetical protein
MEIIQPKHTINTLLTELLNNTVNKETHVNVNLHSQTSTVQRIKTYKSN